MVQMENMHLNNTYNHNMMPHHHQSHPPPSQPYHQQHLITLSSFMMNNQRNIKMQPSFSAPIIGSNSQQGNNPHHKSWPDVLFGGRDLFDTLPIRRASSSTQHAFEFIPNSTTTSSSSTTRSSAASVAAVQTNFEQKKNPMWNSKFLAR
jgi:hypothetical protein